jgi:quinol-cytochrome oxidoreductase complex cytochrome b subunit
MADQNPKEKKSKQLLPFWPHYVLSEFIAWYFMLGVLIILASLMPADLQDKADALRTPPEVKPEWYFLFVYQLLKDVAFLSAIHPELPKLAGIVIPGIGLVFLALLPFLDKSKRRPAKERPVMLAVVAIILLIIIFLTIRGQFVGESTSWLIYSQWLV